MFPDTPAFYEALRKVDFFVDTDLFPHRHRQVRRHRAARLLLLRAGRGSSPIGGFAHFPPPVIPPLYEPGDTDILRDLAELMELDDPPPAGGYGPPSGT